MGRANVTTKPVVSAALVPSISVAATLAVVSRRGRNVARAGLASGWPVRASAPALTGAGGRAPRAPGAGGAVGGLIASGGPVSGAAGSGWVGSAGPAGPGALRGLDPVRT